MFLMKGGNTSIHEYLNLQNKLSLIGMANTMQNLKIGNLRKRKSKATNSLAMYSGK